VRILHLEAGSHLYGGALQVLLLVRGLQERGIETLLVVPRGSGVEREARRRGLPCEALPLVGEADLRFFFGFRSLAKRWGPDLVHLHSRRGADTLGALAARTVGAKVVLTRRVDNPEAPWAVGLKYSLFRRVITISDAIRGVLARQGVDPRKLRVILSALDPEPFQEPCDRTPFLREFGLGEDARVVGMAAQFIPRKGHEILLQAVPRVLKDHPEARFLLFGRGPLQEDVERKVRAVGLQEVVRIPGFREDFPRILPCLDLLVHPATLEGLGIVLLQAGAAGVPVVSTATGGIPEVVVHGKTGLLVPPGDPMKLASAMISLLRDPELGRAMGKAARERIRAEFSVDRMVEGNLAVYREVLGTA
jgi:glycosyltransferase involved in cell wall biosynthesis